MNRYIDAEKLKAEIERRKYEWQALLDKNNAVNPTAVEEVMYEDLNILDIVNSLQQEQLIDKNILTWRDVNEIERIINKVHYEFPHGIGEEAFGKLVLERFIDGKDDSQEQPEVDLEKEIEKWRHDHFKGKRDGDYNGEYLERKSQLDLARRFYEFGLNAKKEK